MAALDLPARSAVCCGDPDIFASEMIKMINDKEFSDVRFVVGEERQTIYVHKCILATRCEVFRAMFATSEHSEKSTPFVLTDVQPTIFLSLLEFIYTNCCSLSTDMVIEVLSASIEYGLDGLTRICIRFMRDSITIDTVCEFTQAALTYQYTTLQEDCLTFINENTKAVFRSERFNELSEDALAFILQSDKLKMDEEDILNRVLEWAAVNSVVTGQSLQDVAVNVVPHVRFALLSPEKLTQIERDNEQRKIIPVALISGAWKFHALKKVDMTDPQMRPRVGTIPRPSHKALIGTVPE